MAAKFSVKQIAAQAGLSTATVDRVLNNRPGVRHQTRLRVEQALAELDDLSGVLSQQGRTFFVDLIMQAPNRFSGAVRDAMSKVAAQMQPFRVRPRFHLYEDISLSRIEKLIHQCRRNGSHGIILKAPDEPEINAAVQAVTDVGVPVVTLVTDLPYSGRQAYIGIDNRAAGRTAAYMLGSWARGRRGGVLVNLSSQSFRGEEEREIGFRQLLREQFNHLEITEASGGLGVYDETRSLCKAALAAKPELTTVYSIGGGNQAILDAFSDHNRKPELFIAHDLDRDNRYLLLNQLIDLVIDHNLESDARLAYQHLLYAHQALSEKPDGNSQISVITPYSLS